MLVPKLRFKREDGTDYPEWRTTQLSTYLFENKDRNVNNDYGKQDVLSVSGEFGVVNQIEFQGRSFAGADVSLYHILYSGDIVYTKSPLKANPYGIIKYNQGVTGIVSTLYAVYHCKSNVDGRFIEYYFDDDLILNKYLKPLVNIGSKHDMKINNEYALSGNVCFPCLEEQQKIADFLSTVDEVIAQSEAEVQNLKQQKKAAMQKIFSQEVRFKREDGTEYPEWEEKTLQDVSQYITTTGTGIKSVYVGTENMQKGCAGVCFDCDDDIAVKGIQYVPDDILISNIRPYLKKAWKADRNGICSTDVLCIRGTSEILSDFLYTVLSSDSFFEYVMQGVKGTKMPRGDKKHIMEMPVFIPCFEEQQKIADFLSAYDEAISYAKQELEHWKQLKKGLLQQMFV